MTAQSPIKNALAASMPSQNPETVVLNGTSKSDESKSQKKNNTINENAMSPINSAKRRRIDAQNISAKNRLTRPFKSPLKVADNSSGSPPPPPRLATNVSYPSYAKPALKTPRRSNVSTSMTTPTPAMKTTTIANSPFKSFTPKKIGTELDPEIASLQKQLRALEEELVDAKANLERAIQAVKIEDSGEDKKLEELIVKWRLASQRTADHLFGIAEERVEKMGGVQVWKEMNERGRMGGGGGGSCGDSWGYADNEGGVNPDGKQLDPEELARLKQEYEAEYGVDDGGKEDDGYNNASKADEDFTMDLMLKTLNIDLDVIGFDKDYQRWI